VAVHSLKKASAENIWSQRGAAIALPWLAGLDLTAVPPLVGNIARVMLPH
jgi:hypothetical protein